MRPPRHLSRLFNAMLSLSVIVHDDDDDEQRPTTIHEITREKRARTMEYSTRSLSTFLSFSFLFDKERERERDFNRIIWGQSDALRAQNFDGTRKVAITNF